MPLVDWGARFEAIRLPARLRVDVRTIDRNTVKKVATGHRLDVDRVRKDARDEIATYLRNLILIVLLCGGVAGDADRVRGARRARRRSSGTRSAPRSARRRSSPRALILFLPPRGQIDTPQYYAFGPDIPRALSAVEAAQRGSRALDQELNAQLVGLARLVTAPGNRPTLDDRPRFTLASDLHNNIVAIPILERTADKGPVFFPGDLTDRGSPIEASLTQRVVNTGDPFVFSPRQPRLRPARDRPRARRRDRAHPHRAASTARATRPGTRSSTSRASGSPATTTPTSATRARASPTSSGSPAPTRSSASRPGCARSATTSTSSWSTTPRCSPRRCESSTQEHRAQPLLFLVGHTHHSSLTRTPGATIINAGTVGAGGTGNLLKHLDVGIARVTYETTPRFTPLAVDLIEIDPRSGNATARRERLDEPVDG